MDSNDNKKSKTRSSSKSDAKAENPHQGHRRRLREQFLRNGLESMSPHQALELLLFYSIPQMDTNVLAHELIKRFGSLAGVFNASFEELISVPNVGAYTACLIKLIPQMYIMYAKSSLDGTPVKSMKELCKMSMAFFYGTSVEETRMICIDEGNTMRVNVKLATGTSSSVRIELRRVVEIAINTGCNKCVLVHNHPGASSMPSIEDEHSTKEIKKLLGLLGITLIDHIIVGNDGVRTVLSGEMSIDSPVPKGTDPKDRPRTPLDDVPQIEYY